MSDNRSVQDITLISFFLGGVCRHFFEQEALGKMLYLRKLWLQLLRYKHQETAATAIEYALLVAFIGVFIIGAVLAIGGSLDGFFQELEALISSV